MADDQSLQDGSGPDGGAPEPASDVTYDASQPLKASDSGSDVIDLPLETQKEIKDEPDAADSDAAHAEAPALEDLPESADSGQQQNTKKMRTFPDGISGPIVVDASDHVAGRLSSLVAKLLLQGKRVSLVNCERIMISGTRSNTIYEYRQFLKINSIINPKHGPVHYRRPDTVITKMIRGMLPFEKKPSGKTAHKRLRAYIGSPRELRPFKRVQFEKAKIRRPASTYTTMGELCRVIGWTE